MLEFIKIITLNHGKPMTLGQNVSSAIPTEGLMGLIETLSNILKGFLSIFGGNFAG